MILLFFSDLFRFVLILAMKWDVLERNDSWHCLNSNSLSHMCLFCVSGWVACTQGHVFGLVRFWQWTYVSFSRLASKDTSLLAFSLLCLPTGCWTYCSLGNQYVIRHFCWELCCCNCLFLEFHEYRCCG